MGSPIDDELAAALAQLVGAEVSALRRLSGGASRETWSFEAGGEPLILQRRQAGAGSTAVGMDVESAVLRAAAAAGVPVPRLVADATDGAALGAPAFVVERLAGETIARKLLRDDEFAEVRPRIAGECGSILAAIHAIPTERIPGLPVVDPLRSMRETIDGLDQPLPVFELALRWLERHRPPGGRQVVVHGDFRTGNLIVDRHRVVAVLDWELAHRGDPLEDLGWFCVRAWRFGAHDHPAGGFGTRQQLWDAYAAAGGARVDPDVARWWEIYGTLRWGVICLVQAATHLRGLTRSMELASIGRRAAENEHDVLALIAPHLDPPAPAAVDGPAPAAPYGRPTAAELVDAVREWTERDVVDGTEGRLQFHARVAARTLGVVERELHLGAAHAAAHAAQLQRLGVVDEHALVAAIRAGAFDDDRWDAAVAELWAGAVDRLEVAHPGYAGDRP